MRRRAKGLLPGLLAVASVLVAVTVYFASPLFGATTVQAVTEHGLDDDVANLFEPLNSFEFRYVKAHHTLPEWIDAIGLGTPEVSLGTTSNAYLPRLAALEIASSPGSAADILAWLEALAGSLAVLALARRYRLAWGAAAAAGAAYPLAHMVVRWMPFFSVPVLLAALPVVVLGLELIWARRLAVGGAVAVVGLGFGGIGGSVLFTQLAVQVAALLILYRLVVTQVSWREQLARAGASALAIGIGVVAASPGWLPFALEQSNTVRTSTAFSLIPPVTWTTLRSILSPTAQHSTSGINGDLYVSLLAPLLVLAGIVRGVRSRLLGFVPLYAAVLLLIGVKTPLLRVLIAVVPGWQYVSSVERYVSFLSVLPLVLLFGMGVDLLLGYGRKGVAALAAIAAVETLIWAVAMHRARAGALAPVAIAALAVAALAAVAYWYRRIGRDVASVVVGIALVAAGVGGSLSERQLGWRPVPDRPDPPYRPWLGLVARYDDPSGRWMSYCQQLNVASDPATSFTYRPDTFLDVPGRWLDTYVSFPAPDYYAYWQRLTRSSLYTGREFGNWFQHTPDAGEPNAALVDGAGISRVLGSSVCHRPLPASWRPLASARATPTTTIDTVYANAGAYPQAYVSRRWKHATSRDAAIASLASVRDPSFRTHVDEVQADLPRAPGGDPLRVMVRRVSGTELKVRLTGPLSTGGLLVVLDYFDPQWHAYVDGERKPIERTNGVFQGVYLPAGRRSVTLRYEPWWTSTLYPMSWALIGLALAVIAWAGAGRLRQVEP
jgi:hypothetical protein